MWTAIRDPLFDESEVLERGAGQRLRFFHARGFLAGAANADSQEHLSFKYVERTGNRTGDPIGLLAKTGNGTWLAALSLVRSRASLRICLRPILCRFPPRESGTASAKVPGRSARPDAGDQTQSVTG